MDGLDITADVVIPEDELDWRFDPSGGPGGQHANRSATRATVRWDPAASRALDAETLQRLLTRLEPSLVAGAVEVSVDATRSQWRNRQKARSALARIVREAITPEPPPRKPTRPSASVRRRRLESKRRRSAVKRLRRPPSDE